MITIENLTKRFGSYTAVDNLSFSVEPGTVLGFLGPNGAGKSTTMKMITGFLTPTSGRIEVAGHNIATHPIQAKMALGYLPEGAPSYGDMTPHQFLQFVAQMRGLDASRAAERIEAVVDAVHLNRVLHQPIETLSKGFKRRVGLAQAILHDPKILILDEPTDGLDPNQKHEVRNLIRGMASDKIIIISTHILEEVSAVCNRAMIINAGKKVADGAPSELEAKSRYHNAVKIQTRELDTLQSGLRAVAGVASVEVDADNGLITAFPKDGQPILPEVIKYLQSQQINVDGITAERGLLDEVFREITGGALQ